MAGSEKSKSRQSRSGQGFCQMSTTDDAAFARLRRNSAAGKAAKIAAKTQSVKNPNHDCTKLRHPPVDELHSLENKPDTSAKKQLTYKMDVVKTTSFFGSFQGSSGWR
jgi:hypothetical protein